MDGPQGQKMVAMTNCSGSSMDNFTNISYTQEYSHTVVKVIEQYTMPVICLLGILGNTMAAIVFLQKSLRNSSCSVFLATRSFSDNGFLATLLLIWVSSTFDLQLSAIVPGLCKVIVFLTYVCGCVSVWLVVFVTAENYIRVCKPFIVTRICTVAIARIVVFMLYVIVLLYYNFPFWAMDASCRPIAEHSDTIQGMVYADTLITLVIPTVCITVLMVAIGYSLINSFHRRGRLSAPTVKRVKNPMAKVTKMLLAVTVSWFVLNVPSHVIRIRLMITTFLKGYQSVSSLEGAIQTFTLLIYYLSMSINVVVYLIFGAKFRKIFCQTFLGCLSMKYRFSASSPSVTRTEGKPMSALLTGSDIVSEVVPLNPPNHK